MRWIISMWDAASLEEDASPASILTQKSKKFIRRWREVSSSCVNLRRKIGRLYERCSISCPASDPKTKTFHRETMIDGDVGDKLVSRISSSLGASLVSPIVSIYDTTSKKRSKTLHVCLEKLFGRNTNERRLIRTLSLRFVGSKSQIEIS